MAGAIPTSKQAINTNGELHGNQARHFGFRDVHVLRKKQKIKMKDLQSQP